MAQANPNRWKSPTRALLWKEWRQQRWVFLALGIIPPLAFLSLLVISHFVASVAALFFFCAIPVVLGASAFCAEDDDQTSRFLNTVPVSWATGFWVKAFVVLALNCAAALGLALIMLAVTSTTDASQRLGMDDGIRALMFIVPFVFIASHTAAIVSVLARRTISCVLATVTVLALACAWIAIVVAHLIGEPSRPRDLVAPLICLILMTLLPIAGSRWLWCWAKRLRPLRARIARVLLIVLVFILITSGLQVIRYVHVTFFASLGQFTRGNSPTRRAQIATCLPDGKSIVIQCYSTLWNNGGRCAVVDVETGEWRWLSRLSANYVYPLRRGNFQSPDYLMLLEGNDWLWPVVPRNLMAWCRPKPETYTPPFKIVNLESHHKQPLSALCPDLDQRASAYGLFCVGWLTREVATLWDGDSAFFANVEDGTVAECMFVPEGKGDTLEDSRWQTDRGFFADIVYSGNTDDIQRLRLARFVPELSVAEIVDLKLEANRLYVSNISSNGRWCVVIAGAKQQWTMAESMAYLCSIETGEAFLLWAPETAEEQGPISARVQVCGFVLDGNTLLLRDAARYVLFDAETHAQRSIPFPSQDVVLERNWRVQISPTGKYALDMLTMRPGVREQAGQDMWVPRDCVVNLETGQATILDHSKPFADYSHWVGDDKLIYRTNSGFWVINRDGTGTHPLLKEDR